MGLYALGSLLRGNRLAQAHFVKLRGPSQLFGVGGTAASTTAVEIKLQKKLLALVGDVVSDVVLHSTDSADNNNNNNQNAQEVNDAIIQAFSTEPICASVSDALSDAKLQETSLRTMEALAPYCELFDSSLIEEIERIQEDWGVEMVDDREHLD